MSKAFLDTSTLTDVLIKRSTKAPAICEYLRRYSEVLVPMYAIKEMKAGPLRYLAWFHNKLVTTRSLEGTFGWLQRLSRTPRRYATSTILEALRELAKKAETKHVGVLVERYGPVASLESVLLDEFRLWTRTAIMLAWAERTKVGTKVVGHMDCYREMAPYERQGILVIEPTNCATARCDLWHRTNPSQMAVDRARAALESLPQTAERQRNLTALRAVSRNGSPNAVECVSLGDVMLALTAPADAVIVTNNIRDFEPLCQALGKQLDRPDAG